MPPKAAKTTKETSEGREGKKAVAGYFDPRVSTGLKRIALNNGEQSIQALLEQALRLLFRQYKEPWPLD